MRKMWCQRVIGAVSDSPFRAFTWLVLAACTGLWDPWLAGVGCAFAQNGGASRSPDASTSGTGSIGTDTAGGDESTSAEAASPGKGGSSESFLSAITNASGPVVIVTIVIALMSFYLIALVVWMAIYYRTSAAVPPELVRDVQNLLEQMKYSEAYQRIATDPSYLARVLSAGVRKLPAGLPQGQRAMELANEDITMDMEHRTTYLATVGTLGPMIGLVGTVYGMIISFRVLAIEGTTPQAGQLAAGISTALYSTFEGIAISIPAIFFYAMYRNRIARLSLGVGMIAESILEQFVPGVRTANSSSRHGYGTPAPATSAAAAPVHPHPFAISAAMAAAGVQPPRPSLPPAEPAQP